MGDEVFPGSREIIFELFFANLLPIYKGRKEIKWCLFRYCIKLHISIGEKWNKKCLFSRWDSFCRDYKYIVGPGYKAQMNIQKTSKSRHVLKFVHDRCFGRRQNNPIIFSESGLLLFIDTVEVCLCTDSS